MNPRTVLRTTLLSAVGPVCLFLSACDPVDDPNAKPKTWRATPEPPRKVVGIGPDNELWLAAWRDLRSRLEPLETRLAALQKLHSEGHFDQFLTLDVNTLNAEQLGSLQQFLKRGYFTLERRVLQHLLERRLDRTDPVLTTPSSVRRSLKENLASAMHRDEIRMVDLETVIKFYEDTDMSNFEVRTGLSEEETASLRDVVSGLIDKTRAEVAAMDRRIAGLQAKAFPGQYPEPPPEPEPEPEVVAAPEGTPSESPAADSVPDAVTPEGQSAATEEMSLFPAPAETEQNPPAPTQEPSAASEENVPLPESE